MSNEVTGTLHGNVIDLDRPVPPLDGCRVRVVLEPLPSVETALSSEEQGRLLREWAASGPQGPLDAEGSWPDETR